MGPYDIYIWPCYLITFGLLGLTILTAFLERRKILKMLRQKIQ
jgi:heme exporter protein CcmD